MTSAQALIRGVQVGRGGRALVVGGQPLIAEFMYGQGMYGPGPMYGPMYGYPKAEAPYPSGLREPAPIKFTEGKLFIGGVDAHIITKDDLVQYCARWGEVADAVVMDKKNYGFVTFADPKIAMKFLETRLHELNGRRLDAKAAVPKAHLGTAKLTKKMFVGGTGDLTDDDFRQHFAQFGEIEDAAVVRREGMSRGFGFVTFADEVSVEKCLLVNHYIKGRKVELKRAVPKEDLGASSSSAAAAGAAAAMQPQQMPGVPGMVPAGYHPMPHPQQMYGPYPPHPYGPAPGHHPPPYGMRPPPGAAPPHYAAPPGMPGDPFAGWYAMGYVPYYHPAAGMPYGPYTSMA
ncbi:hypothetical protein OEZ85_006574 [Tetradesmus obliquus]|uniref:RRM domain-containing protein n=1 Tax=Tetradesmus obliquus TaxID=3088 RepID=A0ABY8TV12_TETOB|nr:hypothetical protein OEZ85_006574 [Tetradesmus obliquus]